MITAFASNTEISGNNGGCHVIFKWSEGRIIQTPDVGTPLPDCRDRGDHQHVRRCFHIRKRSLQFKNPDRKRICCKKVLYFIEKAFNIEVEVSIRQGTFSKGSRTYTVAVLNHEDAIRILKAARLFNADMEIEEQFSISDNLVIQKHAADGLYTRCFPGGGFHQ